MGVLIFRHQLVDQGDKKHTAEKSEGDDDVIRSAVEPCCSIREILAFSKISTNET
jgi:hypothetical protein